MLFLRRAEGESITLFDSRTLCLIKFLRVDPDAKEIEVDIDGIGRRTLKQGQTIDFLQGDATLKFKLILEYDRYPNAASVGVRAPSGITIYRTELLTGLGPDQLTALRRLLSPWTKG